MNATICQQLEFILSLEQDFVHMQDLLNEKSIDSHSWKFIATTLFYEMKNEAKQLGSYIKENSQLRKELHHIEQKLANATAQLGEFYMCRLQAENKLEEPQKPSGCWFARMFFKR